jgi:hypothetical protein
LADLKWNPAPASASETAAKRIADSDYVFRLKNPDDFSTHWYGHKGADVYATRPTSSEWVKFEGNYTVLQRRRTVSGKAAVGGKINIGRK